jgi:tripartite-type tricarboxylate transporter receptor subunit TctC
MSSELLSRWKKSVYAGLVLLVSCLCSQTFAQNFPNKPVKLVVTYPAGGSSDLMARIMGQKLSELWGQPVII